MYRIAQLLAVSAVLLTAGHLSAQPLGKKPKQPGQSGQSGQPGQPAGAFAADSSMGQTSLTWLRL